MSVLHFIGPRGDLTLFVKLVIQQVAVKGVVSRTIFGLVFSEARGWWEMRDSLVRHWPSVCVCMCVRECTCVSFPLCVSL